MTITAANIWSWCWEPGRVTLACFPIRPEHEARPAFTHAGTVSVHKLLFTAVSPVGTVIGPWRHQSKQKQKGEVLRRSRHSWEGPTLTAAGLAVQVKDVAPLTPADVGLQGAETVVLTAVVSQVAEVYFC